jgi:SAM-dependent methyltransferase
MASDDRFDELVASLVGFHRSWLIYLGLELGLFRHLREAGRGGLTPAELASAASCAPQPVEVWALAADSHGLATFEDGRLTVDDDTVAVLLDDRVPEFLGGQFVHTVVASLDWDRMTRFFQTGRPFRKRPDRYRESIERLTVQDIAVFFQEALAALPQLVVDLGRDDARVVDVHCGGGRWLIAMAQRFPSLELVGVEFEPDSVERARRNVEAAGLEGRIRIDHADVARTTGAGEFDLAYFQYALHGLPDPPAALRAAWGALHDGGRVLVLDWPLPSTVDEFRTQHGELIAGVFLDEVFQGTRLGTRETFAGWFVAAGLPQPDLIDLPSGASVFVATKRGA